MSVPSNRYYLICIRHLAPLLLLGTLSSQVAHAGPSATVSACGGEGQRACCLGEPGRPGLFTGCNAGLVERGDDLALDLDVPVSGDATCADAFTNPPSAEITGSSEPRSSATCIDPDADIALLGSNAVIPQIAEPQSGWSAGPGTRGALAGYLDMHLHLLGHMAHGAKNLAGLPAPLDANGHFDVDVDGGLDVNDALSPAADIAIHKNPYHGLLNDTSGDGTKDGSRTEFGAPYFSGWPKWTSTTHQQTYYVWLERAWRGGLRSATMFASHVESLCKTSLKATRATSWPMCEDSMARIVEQLEMAYDFQRFMDERAGGPGLGWFRIVKTPQEARDAIRDGKLAVVLGIEVDNLFNCKHPESGPTCPADYGLPASRIAALTNGMPAPTTIDEAVAVIYAMGVRHVFPVHNFDNGFGAAATWMDAIGVGQAIAEQRWWETRDCGTGKGDYGFWIDNFMQDIMILLGFGVGEAPAIPAYTNGNLSPDYAACNQYGLEPFGFDLLQSLMSRGMLIDIDHMSAYSLSDTVAITSGGPSGNGPKYPVVASHVQAFDLHAMEFGDNKGRHERMRTRAQLEAIRDSGGMVAAMLKDDVQDTDLKSRKKTYANAPDHGPAIADNCRHSSKTWAQLLQYLTDVTGSPVAMGSDFNGAAGHLGPRFGSDACGGWGAPNGTERPEQETENNRVIYPFTIDGFGTFTTQQTGFKAFDYNVDGLAHIGLLPDLIADLGRIGLDQHYVDQLFCSAEAYIRVWERADAIGNGQVPPDPNRPWQCRDGTPPVSQVALAPAPNVAGWNNTAVQATITSTDAGSGVERIFHTLTLGASATSDSTAGDSAVLSINDEGETTLAFHAVDNAGNVETEQSTLVSIDRTEPGIVATRNPVANAAGWNTTDVTVSFDCSDALSGVASCADPVTVSTDGAGQPAIGGVQDKAGNVDSTTELISIDRVAPQVSITGVANGAIYSFGSVPQAGCATSDALSGVATAATVSVTGGAGNGVGSFSVSCSGALDAAGNAGATASASYAVHYVFSGFVQPVDNPPVLNTVKGGQTVPVKFSLGGNQGLNVLQGPVKTAAIICPNGAVLDAIETTVKSPGSSTFFYDPVSNLYQINWKTQASWLNTCRRITVRLIDGAAHTADFNIR